jgi:hypothetical protein
MFLIFISIFQEVGGQKMDDIMLRNPRRGGGGGPRERLIGPKAYGPFSALRKHWREKIFWLRSDDVGQFGPKSATKNKRSIHLKNFLKSKGDESEPAVLSECMFMGGFTFST